MDKIRLLLLPLTSYWLLRGGLTEPRRWPDVGWLIGLDTGLLSPPGCRAKYTKEGLSSMGAFSAKKSL